MPPKLPSEEFLPPVSKFNDTVGPLFAEFRGRFPLNEHRDCGLARSLGIFLNFAFRASMDQLLLLRPGDNLSREEWVRATPETKKEHLRWQSNLRYLKRRAAYFGKLLASPKRIDDDPI